MRKAHRFHAYMSAHGDGTVDSGTVARLTDADWRALAAEMGEPVPSDATRRVVEFLFTADETSPYRLPADPFQGLPT